MGSLVGEVDAKGEGNMTPTRFTLPNTLPCIACGGSGNVPNPKIAGPTFRRIRRRCRIGLRQLARAASVSPGYLSKLERGHKPWQGVHAQRAYLVLAACVEKYGVKV